MGLEKRHNNSETCMLLTLRMINFAEVYSIPWIFLRDSARVDSSSALNFSEKSNHDRYQSVILRLQLLESLCATTDRSLPVSSHY